MPLTHASPLAALGDTSSGRAHTLLGRLEALDMSMLVRKLAESPEGPRWSVEHCEVVRIEYMRFLALTVAFPEAAIVPSTVVDEFWHQHILDTKAYASDCQEAFGFFLHHYPYFGMNGPDDANRVRSAYVETLEAYTDLFGAPTKSVWGAPSAVGAAVSAAKCSTESECFGGGSEGGCNGR